MKTMMKYAAALAVTGAVALATATPSQARWYHHGYHHGGGWAAAGAGFAAGAIVGAAAANSYYGPGYYGPGYYYGPGPYYYGPGYAYEPAPVYTAPRAYPAGRCWHSTDSDRGFGYYGAC